MTYNVLIFKAQRLPADDEGGYSAPLSEIIKGFGATTRDSPRIHTYIDQMASTVVRWFPLSASDETQASIDGLEAVDSPENGEEGRIFPLLAEARFSRRSGELWVTWFFPPTIREMVIEPKRWAQIDIRELAALSHYASVALYEICARYKDVPGGLTNRATPEWWSRALRSDPDTKPREWRKFKNETLKPAIAEICQRTSLDVQLVEYKRGRAVTEVQFAVKRKPAPVDMEPVDLTLVEEAGRLGIRERELDQVLEEHGEEVVRTCLHLIQGRLRAQPTVPIANPIAYLRKLIKNNAPGPLFEQPQREVHPEGPASHARPQSAGGITDEAWLAQRLSALTDEMNRLSDEELEVYAQKAVEKMSHGAVERALLKRFATKQYRSPMVWGLIRQAYADDVYGEGWKLPPRPIVDTLDELPALEAEGVK